MKRQESRRKVFISLVGCQQRPALGCFPLFPQVIFPLEHSLTSRVSSFRTSRVPTRARCGRLSHPCCAISPRSRRVSSQWLCAYAKRATHKISSEARLVTAGRAPPRFPPESAPAIVVRLPRKAQGRGLRPALAPKPISIVFHQCADGLWGRAGVRACTHARSVSGNLAASGSGGGQGAHPRPTQGKRSRVHGGMHRGAILTMAVALHQRKGQSQKNAWPRIPLPPERGSEKGRPSKVASQNVQCGGLGIRE